MKILVVNLHSSANAGDDVLTQETVRQLREAFADASITLAMNDPDSYDGPAAPIGSLMTWFKQERHWRWWALPGLLLFSVVAALGYRLGEPQLRRLLPRRYRLLLDAYFEADLVVSGAGNFLYSSGYVGLTFLISIYTMAYALLAGKPLYNMPQTVGPLRRGWEKALVRWIVSRMPLFLVRDVISQHQLEDIGAWHPGCRLVPDLAFALQPNRGGAGERLLRRHGIVPGEVPLLGVTLIDWEAQNILFRRQETYETSVAAAIRTFVIAHSGRCLLFAQVRGPSAAEDDRIPARRVRALLGDLGDAVVLLDEEVSASELKAAYGCMDLFMGTRLHSCIFALSEFVPVLTIQYQPKTRGVLRMLGLEEWVVDIEEATDDNLPTMLDLLWKQKETIRAFLRRKLVPVVAQATQVGVLIANYHADRR